MWGEGISPANNKETNYMVYAGADVVADVSADGSLKRSYTYGLKVFRGIR